LKLGTLTTVVFLPWNGQKKVFYIELVPAKIWLDKDAKYFIGGIEYTKQEYWNHPLVIKHKLEKILEEKQTSL